MPKKLCFEYLLTPEGILANQAVSVNDEGRISAIENAGPDDECIKGLALPGMPNAHSHSFQRAITGFGEMVVNSNGAKKTHSFWSWRENMYRLANQLTADQLFAIASQSFMEMLGAGYTSVAEFHYLHHSPDGEISMEMADAVIRAAEETGIRLRLLPVLYMKGGFNLPAQPEHFRFIYSSLSKYCNLLEYCRQRVATGIAPHSLRAVPIEVIPKLVKYSRAVLGENFPIHIHIAEQKKEVQDCLSAHQASPVQLLANTVALTSQWNLVHSTHINGRELDLLSRSNAQVILCPITEAYLGDGIFPAQQFVENGGRYAIGSDSNTRIDAFEELRSLEYAQRLIARKRSRLANEDGIGLPMWEMAAKTGAKALQFTIGKIHLGHFADITVLDTEKVPLLGIPPERMLDAALIGGSRELVKETYVSGDLLVSDAKHVRKQRINENFVKVMKSLRLK